MGSVWKKKTGYEYESSYERTRRSNDRVFVLKRRSKVKTFESWQQAVKEGWKRVKKSGKA